MAMIAELNRSAEIFKEKLKLDKSWMVCIEPASKDLPD
jgi:hypothetical protein